MNNDQLQQLAEEKYTDPDAIYGFVQGALWMQQNQSGMRWVTGDYERLWQWANNPERESPIVIYVDYLSNWGLDEDEKPIRDICHLRDVRFGFAARGIGYSTYQISMDEPEYAHTRFIADCTGYNVSWLDESASSEVERLRKENEEMLTMLKECKIQIEYLHRKFQPTGTGEVVISRADSLIQKIEANGK